MNALSGRDLDISDARACICIPYPVFVNESLYV